MFLHLQKDERAKILISRHKDTIFLPGIIQQHHIRSTTKPDFCGTQYVMPQITDEVNRDLINVLIS